MGRLRTRLPTLLGVWVAAVAAEAMLYYFLTRPYFRRFVTPFALAVLVAALVATWRLVRPRAEGDRRHGDRRHEQRRAEE